MLVQCYHKLHTEAATCRGVLSLKVVLRNFSKVSGKHLCQSLFFNKVEDLFGQPPDDCFQS